MRLGDIQKKYRNQWVLVEFSKLDKDLRVKDGKVLAHASNKEDIYKALLGTRGKNVSIEYCGELPKDLVVMFRLSTNVYERKNSELVKEFNRYVREHPEFADNIPKNAIVVMQLEGDPKFNQRSRKLAESHAVDGQPIVYVHIQKLKSLWSRIEKLELKRVA